MKINGISFGAALNGTGKKIVYYAKVLAGCKNAFHHTNEYSDALANNLATLDNFRPKDTFNIEKNKDTNYRVKLNDRFIYEYNGNEFDFIKDLAEAIKRGDIV